MDPIGFLAEVSLTHQIPSPKAVESSKGKKYLQSQRKKRRIYLSKDGIESLKAHMGDDTTAEDQPMDAVDTEHDLTSSVETQTPRLSADISEEFDGGRTNVQESADAPHVDMSP